MTLCAFWYHLFNLKNVKNAHGGALLFKSNTPPRFFFHVFLILQMVPNRAKHRIYNTGHVFSCHSVHSPLSAGGGAGEGGGGGD